MPNLFGIDIAGILNDAINSAGGLRPATLFKSVNGTRTPGNLGGGTNPTDPPPESSCQVYVEKNTTRIEGTLAQTGGMTIGIIGASISPARVPEPSDEVLVDGVTYTIVSIREVDPADALYVCTVQV